MTVQPRVETFEEFPGEIVDYYNAYMGKVLAQMRETGNALGIDLKIWNLGVLKDEEGSRIVLFDANLTSETRGLTEAFNLTESLLQSGLIEDHSLYEEVFRASESPIKESQDPKKLYGSIYD